MGDDAPAAGLHLHLLSRGEAERVVRRRPDPALDCPWAAEYPLEGDTRACAVYITHLAGLGGPERRDPFGYYQIIEDGWVVGGIGFHGPPRDGLVEVGYGIVPSARRRNVATTALRLLIGTAEGLGGVRQVFGRTSEDNLASQKVMLGAGMQLVGRDPDFLHYRMDLE